MHIHGLINLLLIKENEKQPETDILSYNDIVTDFDKLYYSSNIFKTVINLLEDKILAEAISRIEDKEEFYYIDKVENSLSLSRVDMIIKQENFVNIKKSNLLSFIENAEKEHCIMKKGVICLENMNKELFYEVDLIFRNSKNYSKDDILIVKINEDEMYNISCLDGTSFHYFLTYNEEYYLIKFKIDESEKKHPKNLILYYLLMRYKNNKKIKKIIKRYKDCDNSLKYRKEVVRCMVDILKSKSLGLNINDFFNINFTREKSNDFEMVIKFLKYKFKFKKFLKGYLKTLPYEEKVYLFNEIQNAYQDYTPENKEYRYFIEYCKKLIIKHYKSSKKDESSIPFDPKKYEYDDIFSVLKKSFFIYLFGQKQKYFKNYEDKFLKIIFLRIYENLDLKLQNLHHIVSQKILKYNKSYLENGELHFISDKEATGSESSIKEEEGEKKVKN